MTAKQINKSQTEMIRLRLKWLDDEIHRKRIAQIEDSLETGEGNRPDLTENERPAWSQLSRNP